MNRNFPARNRWSTYVTVFSTWSALTSWYVFCRPSEAGRAGAVQINVRDVVVAIVADCEVARAVYGGRQLRGVGLRGVEVEVNDLVVGLEVDCLLESILVGLFGVLVLRILRK
jgi:hypothetical protein